MGKVHPACAGQHPILSLLPLWVLALRVQAQGARKLRADRGFSPGPAISLAGFLVTLYGRIEVTPEESSARPPSSLSSLLNDLVLANGRQ